MRGSAVTYMPTALISAPCSRRAFTTLVQPLIAAECKGVHRSLHKRVVIKRRRAQNQDGWADALVLGMNVGPCGE